MSAKNKIIVALDGMDYSEAIYMAQELSGLVWGFKLHTLLLLHGVDIIPQFKQYGNIFADLKFHDIPTTVAYHVKSLKSANFISIHLAGEEKMIAAAMTAKYDSQKILGVLMLSSLQYFTWCGLSEFESMVDGVIGPPIERDNLTVTPGIRPSWYPADDHGDNAITPEIAINEGADYLVIGRPITLASDPVIAVEKILEEIT